MHDEEFGIFLGPAKPGLPTLSTLNRLASLKNLTLHAKNINPAVGHERISQIG